MASVKQRISSLFQARWIPWCAAASIVASLISIAAAYIFAGSALLLWVIDTLRRRRLRLHWPPFALPLLLFVISMGIAVLFSEDPGASSASLKKLVRFLFVPLMFTWFGTVHVKWTVRRIYWVVGASAVYALAQYYWLMEPDLQHRITGFMGHWMTFSGQLMMGAVSLGVFLCRERFTGAGSSVGNGEEKGWRRLPFRGSLLLGVLTWSLLVTFTRNAWLGTAAGVLLLVVLTKKTRVLLLLLALMALLILVPTPFQERLLSGVDLSDTTTQVRLEMVRAGSRLIADHPWTGVGPGMVYREVLKYRSHQEYPDWGLPAPAQQFPPGRRRNRPRGTGVLAGALDRPDPGPDPDVAPVRIEMGPLPEPERPLHLGGVSRGGLPGVQLRRFGGADPAAVLPDGPLCGPEAGIGAGGI